MFCQKCGKENVDETAFCSSCGSALNQSMGSISLKQKEVIEAKIATKRDELEFTGQTGPFIIIIVGVVGLILSFTLGSALLLIPILSIILIIVGLLWSNSRAAADKKIKNEIKELKAELK